jgi:hypothetical protein
MVPVDQDRFVGSRHDRRPIQVVGEALAQLFAGARFAVDDEGNVRRPRNAAEPVHQLILIGVDRERIDLHDVGAYGHVSAVQLHGAGAVGKQLSTCADGLEPREHDGVARVGELPGEVVDNAPASRHPGRGDEDRRIDDVVEGAGVSRRGGSVELTGTLERGISEVRPQLGVVSFDRLAVDVEHGESHWAVDEDRQRWDSLLGAEPSESGQHDLGAVDGECWDEDDAAPIRCRRDGSRQLVQGTGLVLVTTVAVGRLGDDHVGPERVRRRAQQRVVRTPEVAGEQQRALVAQQFELYSRRTEDVSSVAEYCS